MKLIQKYQRFLKFCMVGGSGAIITFGITWILTEKFGLWYMASMVIAVAIATVWNYNFNLFWTFRTSNKFTDANYEWESFYNGNPIQKWWKQSIAKTVWEWIPNHHQLLLDIGCGSSPIISHYSNADGVDKNVDKLEFMKLKLPHINFKESINDYIYDNILCIELLEHLEKPEDMIWEITTHLKVGGRVIIATPDYKRPLWAIAEKFTPYKDDHITKLNRKLLEEMCIQYMLHPIKYRYVAGCDLIEMFEKRI
jgi:2-polyprenyl-3-methyl-5-hydroxy-6-metoxy-1,4-benzoquinol methylase